MKSLLSLTTLLTLLSFAAAYGQQKQLCGFITDNNDTPVLGAAITTKDEDNWPGIGTFADENGFFCLNYGPRDEYAIIEYVGLQDTIIDLRELTGDTLRIKLEASEPIEDIKVYKPAIYLYPTEKAIVSVQHDFKGKLGTTYPAYKNGWHVEASPNGSLLNLDDNRHYEYLFWDGVCNFPPAHFDFKEGFVVARENTTSFLLEKLAYVGLSEKEINDFIVYWLPQLSHNEYNFIHFRINDDIDHSSVLNVDPVPDTWIRLFMEFKPVNKEYSIKVQNLPHFNRNGFTLVEWGGAVIESTLSEMQ